MTCSGSEPPHYVTAAQTNPLPFRRIFPTDGEGKCDVQHSVSVSQ